MTEDEIKETILYKYCLERCASTELKLNIATELKYAFDNYDENVGYHFRFNKDLWDAFTWSTSPQKRAFWTAICDGKLPEEYS